MRRALGKGLSELLGDAGESDLRHIAVNDIVANPAQPRKVFDDEALEQLAESVRSVGVLQPILVRERPDGRYDILAGERRWRAAVRAGLVTVPAVIRTSNETETMEIALIENIQREDISAVELAEAYKKLMEAAGLTQEALGERVGKSRVSIANALRLLQLPEEVRQAVQDGSISEGHARALLMFETDVERIAGLRRILEKGLSVREVERLAKGALRKERRKKLPEAADDLSTIVSERLGAPTKIVRRGKGGKVEIEFFDDDDLARILDVIGAGD